MYVFHERIITSNISNSGKLGIRGREESLPCLGIVSLRPEGESPLEQATLRQLDQPPKVREYLDRKLGSRKRIHGYTVFFRSMSSGKWVPKSG